MSFMMLTTSAKTLEESAEWMARETTQARGLETSELLVAELAKMTQTDLAKAIGVSQKLAQTNTARFKEWTPAHTSINAKPAILMYHGDIYKQFVAKDFSPALQAYAQNHLRISSGLYGLLRPYDLIKPYRLEMRSKFGFSDNQVMADYWQKQATEWMNQDIEELGHTHMINLASKEYARVIDTKMLKVPMITIEFQEKKGDQLKTIPLYSKQARGMMVGFAIKNQIEDIEGLKDFTTSGYKFHQETSDSLVFVRDSQKS